MGDRVLVIFHDKQEVSPVVYLHWGAEGTPALLKKHAEFMKDRKGDVQYGAARFVGLAHAEVPNLATGIGIWNLEEGQRDAVMAVTDEEFGGYKPTAEKLVADMSHGDGGVVLVNVDDFSWKAYGGYLERYDHEKGEVNWEAA